MPLTVGDPAPQFSGTDILTNTSFSLAQHAGKCVLVAFHGYTWCPPCQFAVPLLQEVWEEYQMAGAPVQFVVVSINDDPLGPQHLQGITMPWLKEPWIPTAYEAGSPPLYFFLDWNLVIGKIQQGLFSSNATQQKNGVRQAIDECLKTPKPQKEFKDYELKHLWHEKAHWLDHPKGRLWKEKEAIDEVKGVVGYENPYFLDPRIFERIMTRLDSLEEAVFPGRAFIRSAERPEVGRAVARQPAGKKATRKKGAGKKTARRKKKKTV